MDKKPSFVIFTPPENVSGGALVLHVLGDLLHRKGYSVKIFLAHAHRMKPGKRLSFYYHWAKFMRRLRKKGGLKGMFATPLKRTPFVGKNDIVVYPEVVEGNPLGGSRVVRWLLHRPGFHTGTVRYTPGELFFSYQPVFNDPQLNPEQRALYLCYINTLYRQTNFGERSGTCYLIRKGSARADLPDSFDGPVIDDYTDEQKQEAFNRFAYCVSYDTQTYFCNYAAMCGCIPVVMPEPGVSKAEWQPVEEYRHGVAYGLSEAELEFARDTRHLLVEASKRREAQNGIAVDHFIRECEAYFSELS